MRNKRLVVATLMVAVVSTLLVGCGKQSPIRLSSPWPRADSERVVPPPPEPARWPYTGAKADDAEKINDRPLSIKIENSAASRPQTGLNSADVVYETISEGGITRFNSIFHSNKPKIVGPVRSARLSDLWVVPQYDGLFFFSGASASVENAVNQAGLPNLSQDAGVTRPYFRSSARPAPHNLFLRTADAYPTAKSRGYATTANLEPLQFDKHSAEGTQTISEINIPFSTVNRVRWAYDNGRWKRFNNGVAHVDAATGKQITADNVVVLWVRYAPASRDKVGSTTFRVELGGKGRVSVFKKGQRFDGTWTADRNAPPRFKDSSGRPIKLTIGRTWFQVLPLDGVISMK